MASVAARKPSVGKDDWPGLAATLAGFEDDRLARLLTLRPDLASPAPPDLATLAARAGAWSSARDCYFGTDHGAQRVIEALCLLPQPTALADVASLLGVAADDADLASALHRLEDRALAFPLPGDRVRLLPALAQLEHPAGLGPPLATILAGHTGLGLTQMAVRLGAKPGATKPATLAAIAGILADPAQVERLVQRGPEGTVELARRVAADGPIVSVGTGLYGANDRSPAGWLVNRGMLSVVNYYSAVMPREPAVALRGGAIFPAHCLRRPQVRTAPVDPGGVDRAAAERALRVVADVAAIVEQWSDEPPAVLKSGGVGIREVRRAAKATERTEVEAARIMEVAAVAGLVRVDIVTGGALATAGYDEWLALEAPARWARLATAWMDSDLHLSLAGAISTKDKPIPPLLDRAPEHAAADRRRLVLAVLEEAAPGAAVTAADVRDRVQWDGPRAWGGGPAAAPTLVSWVPEEAELVGLAALGSLSTAGRALVAGAPAEAIAALAVLAPPAVAEFVVQADLTAVIAGEPAPVVRSELGLLADVESKGAATVYRFSESSLRRAFDSGRTTADILGFLERHASRGVPQPLSYLVNDLGRRFGNVRVGAATSYLRSDEPALLAEVLQAKRTSRLRLRPLAPTVAVTDVDAATVTETLQAAGYLPARESADGSLLLTRPPARRLPDKPLPHLPGRRADPATIVAELRRKPLPAEPSVSRPPASIVAPARWPPPAPSETFRPYAIVKGPRAIRALLDQACEEYWVVRLSYVSAKGHSTELTVEPTDVNGRRLYAACFPRGNDRTFTIARIEWARVLTEAEEELLP